MQRIVSILILLLFLFSCVPGCVSFDKGKNRTIENASSMIDNCTGCYVEEGTSGVPLTLNQSNQSGSSSEEKIATGMETVGQSNESENGMEKIENVSESSAQEKACIGLETYDIFVTNSVVFNGENYSDICVTAGVVKKYYCRNDTAKADNLNCPSGYWCKNGACVEFQKRCIDPDGNDTEASTTITVIPAPFAFYTESDSCEDDAVVREWLCNESVPYYMLIRCPSGKKCSEGSCVKSRCNETDGGDVPEIFGEVRTRNETYRDECVGDKQLKEYYCYGDDATLTLYRCADKCRDDKCTPEEGS
ncbi:MAG: hypothetical protein QW590_01835 [Candidatus Bilamarchaeaceae archaeon]